MTKERGNALIIAILIVAAIGAIAFGFGRIFLLESSNALILENGRLAYYAAESGIEEGFLRYKYDRNSEIPFTDWTSDGENNTRVFRTNLTDGSIDLGESNKGILKTAQVTFLPKQIYDLRVGSKIGSFAGEEQDGLAGISFNDIKDSDYASNATSAFRIKRDEAKKIDLLNIFSADVSSDLNFYIRPILNSADTTRPAALPLSNVNCVMIEARIIGQVGAITEERKVMLKNPSCNYAAMFDQYEQSAKDYLQSTDPAVFQVVSLKSVIAPGTYYDKAVLYLKPIGTDIGFMLQETNTVPILLPDNELMGGEYSITSTGYFGGVTRTLSADIDRQSGTLYDLFDYVIYDAE